MNKINLFSLALLATVSTVFTSCKEDDDAIQPVVVQENEVPNGSSKLVYSVQVRASSVDARTSGLAGAKVSVNQGGSIKTITTDESGIATFDDMKAGYVSVFVESEGYLSENFDDDIECYNCDYDQLDKEQTEYDQTTVNMHKLGATLTGFFYGDFDNDGGAYVDEAGDRKAGITVKYTISSYYQPNVFTATTDANGKYTFTNLPEGVNGTLSVEHHVERTNSSGTDAYTEVNTFYRTISVSPLTVKTPTALGNYSLFKSVK